MGRIEKTKYPGIRKYVGPRGTSWLVDYRDATGKSQRLTCRSLKEAIATRDKKRREPGGDPRGRFSDWAERWLLLQKPVVRPSSHKHFEGNLRLHILPVFGQRRILAIERIELVEFLAAKIAGGLAAKTASNILSTLFSVFHFALKHKAIPTNPAYRVSRDLRLKQLSRTKGVRAFTRDEVRALLAAAVEWDKGKGGYPLMRPVLFTMARTGLRISEAVGLKWGDLDFDNRDIHVRRRLENRTPADLKTEKSRRTVDMSRELRVALVALERAQKEQMLKMAWRNKDDYVFTMPANGLPARAKYLSERFPEVLELAELPRKKDRVTMSPHCLRHTFASLLLQAGKSPSYVQDQLGHESIATTKDLYGHWFPASDKAAVDSLDNGFAERQGKLELL